MLDAVAVARTPRSALVGVTLLTVGSHAAMPNTNNNPQRTSKNLVCLWITGMADPLARPQLTAQR
jgi:hypothetical protein